MGIAEAEAMNRLVGTIVWVRRRNGSWWPGRVLGQNELSTVNLTSSKPGTPVKLLGREDASIDWYNLVKSKRVKSFRCGDFDDCIRKAESCQGMPPKKREKYARREDAILHALEIEKHQNELKEEHFATASSYRSDRKFAARKKQSEHSFHSSSNSDEEEYGYISRCKNKTTLVSKNLPMNNEYVLSPMDIQKKKRASRRQGDNNNAKVIPRMRGLQDFGLKIASSKIKDFPSTSCKGRRRTLLSQNLISSLSPSSCGTPHLIGSRKSPLAIKRTSHGISSEESLVKRRDRRHTLVQVFQSCSKSSVSHTSESDGVDIPISVNEEAPSRGTLGSLSVGNPSYDNKDCPWLSMDQAHKRHPQVGVDDSVLYPSLLTEGELMDEADPGSFGRDSFIGRTEEDTTMVSEFIYGSPVFSVQEQPSCEGFNDRYSNYASASFEQKAFNDSVGISKWKLKGKRNMRNLSRRDIELSDGCTDSGLRKADESFSDMNSGTWFSREDLQGYREEPDDCFRTRLHTDKLDPLYGRQCKAEKFESDLVNVNLKVQASYQGEHVPLVSLMSRLNGKAIIGHPVQIEIMEDGASELLFTDIGFDGDTGENIERKQIQSIWRTARRTAMQRIPRSNPSGSQGNEDNLVPYFSLESRPPLKKKSATSAKHKKRSRKKWKHALHSLADTKSSKLLSKVCVSNQKTMVRPSFASERKTSDHDDNSEVSVPAVSCITVKDVFSRLKESFSVMSTISIQGNADIGYEHAVHH